MSVEAFVDTNVLIYAAAGRQSHPEKHRRAWEILGDANYGLSGQVLAEFYVNARKETKTQRPLTDLEAAAWIDRLSTVPVVPVDHLIVQQGIAYSQRFQISYWDAALIAAAEVLDVPTIYTEDLNHGQQYGSVTAINPFKEVAA